MWRKIHSNRNPKDTLYSELLKEFRPRLQRAARFARRLIAAHPRKGFAIMSASLLVSAVLSFSVFRHPDERSVTLSAKKPAVLTDGLNRIIQAADGIHQTIRLKAIVDSLTGRPELNSRDSVVLDSVLTRLQQIQQPQQ